MTTTQFPEYNARANLDWIYQTEKMETTAEVVYGADFEDKENRLYLTHKANFYGKVDSFKMEQQGKIIAKPLVSTLRLYVEIKSENLYNARLFNALFH